MGKKMLELCFIILRMMLESLGMEKHYDSHVESTSSVLRLMKYRVGPANGDSAQLGLVAHTDKSALTILCQNEVQGLELLTKQGTWLQLKIPEASFVVFVGDALKAWSNGRLHAATHRVIMKGDKERYSCGLFLVPKEEATIEVPQELIDKEHPLLYRPFKFSDYFSYFVSNTSDDALEIYAGL
ncbi:Flavonol synthase/flavanone 3-hydroxylase [Morus notabilis]|uniref:Flavonol synthase/flavanone 3-hydroxylase n=2 Tax=Morus notabilis TaxID=981085 RepID=W9SHQ4_9ROSA|nr:Flavonol synthase/flavanone 3-hydroxylase [Morus notabilis]